MKQEEKILHALGNVKDSYIMEASRYVGNPQRDVLIRPKKPRWKVYAAMAAAAALVLTGALTLFPMAANRRAESSLYDTSLATQIQLAEGCTLKVVFETPKSQEGCQPIHQVLIYEEDNLVQTIDESSFPDHVDNYSEGLFVNLSQPTGQPDFRDVNFDGYTDLGFLAVSSSQENTPYSYYLWNSENAQFEYGFTLYGGTALEVDEQNKLLVETVLENGSTIQRYYSFDTGSIHSISAEALSQAAARPQFRISYNTETLAMTEGTGGVFIAPRAVDGSLPTCEIQIEFLTGLLPSAAVHKSLEEMTDGTVTVQQDEQTGYYYFHIPCSQESWDAEIADVWIVGAGSQGSFRLTARYFLEATEGWGTTFNQICASFTCPLTESANPEAEQVIMAFADAYFSADKNTMQLYLYNPSQTTGGVYTGDGNTVEVVTLRGLEWLDSDIQQNDFGVASLTFLETELDDSFTYLSMEIMKTQAGYRVRSYGLEK